MDTSEYMPMFLAEAREHLEQLNLAIVRLEEDPNDRATVEEIFRIAHSFKGMSATMGFAKIAELTHNMEDVFELLRQRTNGLPSEAIDTVFACLDALLAATDSIETDGQEDLDPAPLVRRLRSLVRPRTPEQEVARAGGIDAPDHAAVQAAREAGARVLRIRVNLIDDVMMPAVRAHMVLAALSDHGEVLGSMPAHDGLEQFQGREIDVWVACDHEDDPIVQNLGAISEVATRGPSPTSRRPRPGADPPTVAPPVPERRRPAPRAGRRADVRPPTAESPATAVQLAAAGRTRASTADAPSRPSPPARSPRLLAEGDPHGARRRRAPRRADALDGRAGHPPHRGRGPDRQPRDRGPPARRPGAHPLIPGAPGDGHAGPHDPRRRGLPALPAPDPRPLDQARQGGQARADRL